MWCFPHLGGRWGKTFEVDGDPDSDLPVPPRRGAEDTKSQGTEGRPGSGGSAPWTTPCHPASSTHVGSGTVAEALPLMRLDLPRTTRSLGEDPIAEPTLVLHERITEITSTQRSRISACMRAGSGEDDPGVVRTPRLWLPEGGRAGHLRAGRVGVERCQEQVQRPVEEEIDDEDAGRSRTLGKWGASGVRHARCSPGHRTAGSGHGRRHRPGLRPSRALHGLQHQRARLRCQRSAALVGRRTLLVRQRRAGRRGDGARGPWGPPPPARLRSPGHGSRPVHGIRRGLRGVGIAAGHGSPVAGCGPGDVRRPGAPLPLRHRGAPVRGGRRGWRRRSPVRRSAGGLTRWHQSRVHPRLEPLAA